MRTWFVVFALVVAGCKAKPNAGAGSGSAAGSAIAAGSSGLGSSATGSSNGSSDLGTGSGSTGSGSGSDAAADGSGAGSDAAANGSGAGSAAGMLPELPEKKGVIFTEAAGGAVSGLRDGTVVDVVSVKDMMVGSEEDGEVKVKGPSGVVALKADRVIVDAALKRSPDSKFAVFAPVVACGDFCHTVVWLVGADGRRTKVGEAGPDVNAAWHPKGGTVAVGAGGLYLVTLADFKVKKIEGYTSPAYGPDGTLYVRSMDGSAFVMNGDKPKRVWKAPKKEAAEEDEMSADEPPPVTFENGKPKYELPY